LTSSTRVADHDVADRFDAGQNVAHGTGAQLGHRLALQAQQPDLFDLVLFSRIHQADRPFGAERSVLDPAGERDTAIRVVRGVE
jgi:hypothetical protein